jgi:hypothetical protein
MLVPAPANRASRSRHSLSFRERVPRTIAVLLEKKDFVNEIPPRYRSRQEWLWRALTVAQQAVQILAATGLTSAQVSALLDVTYQIGNLSTGSPFDIPSEHSMSWGTPDQSSAPIPWSSSSANTSVLNEIFAFFDRATAGDTPTGSTPDHEFSDPIQPQDWMGLL